MTEIYDHESIRKRISKPIPWDWDARIAEKRLIEKKCKMCEGVKLGTDFLFRRITRTGNKAKRHGKYCLRVSPICDACRIQQRTDTGRTRFKGMRIRANKSGLEFSVDLKFVNELIKSPCEYCGYHGNITVDRFDNCIGYTRENCKPCCVVCNTMKSNLSKEAWLIIAPAVRTAREMGLIREIL